MNISIVYCEHNVSLANLCTSHYPLVTEPLHYICTHIAYSTQGDSAPEHNHHDIRADCHNRHCEHLGLVRFHETQDNIADFVFLAHSTLLHYQLVYRLLALAYGIDTNDSETVRTVSRNLFDGTEGSQCMCDTMLNTNS